MNHKNDSRTLIAQSFLWVCLFLLCVMRLEATCTVQCQRRMEEAIGCPGAVGSSCGELPEEIQLRSRAGGAWSSQGVSSSISSSPEYVSTVPLRLLCRPFSYCEDKLGTPHRRSQSHLLHWPLSRCPCLEWLFVFKDATTNYQAL